MLVGLAPLHLAVPANREELRPTHAHAPERLALSGQPRQPTLLHLL
jgi:hypothetical protein